MTTTRAAQRNLARIAIRKAALKLAIHEGDTEAIDRLLGELGELTTAHLSTNKETSRECNSTLQRHGN